MKRLLLILLIIPGLACMSDNSQSPDYPSRLVVDTISGADRIWDVELNITNVCCEWQWNCGWCNLGGQGSMGLSEYFDFIMVIDISDYGDSITSAEIHLWCWLADSIELYAMVNPLIEPLITKNDWQELDGIGVGDSPVGTDYAPTGYCRAAYNGECYYAWHEPLALGAGSDYDSTAVDSTLIPTDAENSWQTIDITNCVNHFISHDIDLARLLIHGNTTGHREFKTVEHDSACFVEVYRD